jgi:hypothetical protein
VNRMPARTVKLCVLTILILAALWRFRQLDRDPPLISPSTGEWSDPGVYLYNARSFLRNHDWAPAEPHGLSVAPGFVLLATLWGLAFGSGYAAFAALSVICGFVAAASTARIAGKDPSILLATLFPLAISYTYFCFQRVPKGDMETLAVSAIAAAVLVSLENGRRERALAFAGGLLAALAPFIKLYGVLFAISSGAAWFLSPLLLDESWKKRWPRLTIWFVLGSLASIIFWLSWAVWLKQLGLDNVTGYAGRITESVTGTESTVGVARLVQSNLIYRQPIETLLATVAVARLLALRRWNWALLFCTTWLLTGFIAMSFMNYAPTRYRLLFIPPAVVLGSLLWMDLASGRASKLSARASGFVYGVTAWIAVQSLAYFCRSHPALNSLPLGAGWQLVYVLIGAIILWIFFERLPQPPVAFCLAGLMIAVAVPQWWIGERSSGYQMKTLAEDLERSYPGAVLVGPWSSELALWTNLDTPNHGEALPLNALLIEENQLFDTSEWMEIRRLRLDGIDRTLVVGRHR